MALEDLQLFAEQESQFEKQKQGLTQSASFAFEQNPDEYAKTLKLAAQTGVAPEVAKDFRPELELRQKMSSFSADDIVRSNPATAVFLSNPDNLAVAQDDVSFLTTLENTFKSIPAGFEQGAGKRRQMELNYKEVVGNITPSEQAELAALDVKLQKSAKEFNKGFPSWTKEATDTIGMAFSSIAEAARTEGAQGMAIGATTYGTLGLIGGPGAPATVAAGATAGAGIGFTTGTSAGYFINSYEIAVGEAYADLKAFKAPDGTKIDPTVARYAAVIVGVPNTALETFALKKALKLIPGADKLMGSIAGDKMKEILVRPTVRAAMADIGKKYAGAVAAETFTEGLQKFVNILAREVAQEVSPGDFPAYDQKQLSTDVEDVVAESTAAFKASVILGAGGGGVKAYQAKRELDRAQTNIDIFTALGDQAQRSKLVQNMPEKFQEFVQRATEDGPVQNVYIDANRFTTFFQSQGVDPAAVAAELNVRNLEEAVTGGTDVVIPIADFASKVAPTKYLQGLSEDIRLNQGDLSAREARIEMANEEARMVEIEAQLDQIVSEQQSKAGLDRAVDKVITDIEGQLLGVGYDAQAAQRTAKVMKGLAVLAQRDVTARAEEQGREATPDEIYAAAMGAWERYGLTVSRPMPDVLTRDTRANIEIDPLIERLRTGDLPLDEQIFGTSLAEFIRQSGGIQSYGELQDADYQRAPFQRNLIQEAGMTADEAAMRAVEAGYFPGVESGQLTEADLFNALAEELRGGQATYADANLNYELLDLRDRLMRLDSYLNSIGIDLSQVTDNVQVRRLIDQASQNPALQDIVGQLYQLLGVDQFQGGQQLFQSATLRSGKETLKKYGLPLGGKYKTRDVAAALEARQRDKYGLIDRDDRSPEALTKIAKWMQAEVEFEMESPEKSGVGWYSAKFQRALDIMAQAFPELATDKTARNTMTALIAITSDGQKVVPNFAQAMDIYGNFRVGGATEGRFTTTRGHQRQASIDNNLKIMQRLYDQMGADAMHEYLMQEKTISELKKIAKANGGELKSDYQAHIKMPMAAVEFGPKLGAFYANLMGAHGYLTMDRWWSRTFNRYRGTLLTAPTQVGLDRFKQLLGRPEMSNDEAIAATVEPRNAYEARGFKNGSEIEKAANTIYKAAFEALEDAPFTATDRTFMLDAVSKAQQNLAKKGYNLSVADIQAILWYYEKRLYGELGARQTADISYEEAAQRVAAGYAGGSGVESFLDDDGAAQQDDAAAAGRVPPGEELYNDGSITLNQSVVSRRNLDFREVIRRTPELQVAAQQLQNGEITREQYEQLVNTFKPVEPYDTVPKPASKEQAIAALKKTNAEKEGTPSKDTYYGKPSETLQAGDPVGLRLDIPSYSKTGTWVVTVHGPRKSMAAGGAGARIGYESVAAATDVQFGISDKGAIGIAAGKEKTTIATMEGKWKPITPKKAKTTADAALNDPAWRQVGMDPERHSYFYDRETMDPIVAAEEVIQIGPLVLAKNVTYGERQNFLFQSQPTFYSGLARAVQGAKQEIAPAGDWLAIIKKLPGVKADEISWTGIEEYLQLAGKAKVEKQDILDYLSANGVQVSETILSDEAEYFVVYEDGGRIPGERFDTEAEAEEWISEQVDFNLDGMYRSQSARDAEFDRYSVVLIDAQNAEDADGVARYSDYQLPGGENYKELLMTLPGQAKFQSSHWDEKNILAHVRFNERTDTDGNRVLFIEEMQSDWAQSGRKYGFVDKTPFKVFNVSDPQTIIAEFATIEEANQFRAENPYTEFSVQPQSARVPNAPFVGDTKTWVALTLKRMMRYAAENGFDKVAFVNGEQSAERYDLSKQIDEIVYTPYERALYAYKDGRQVINRRNVTSQDLADYVGKEVAQRLLDSPVVRNKDGIELQRVGGVDLKVGGEGMIAFYDKIVPQVVSEQLKKLGGGRIESVEIASGSNKSFGVAYNSATGTWWANLDNETIGPFNSQNEAETAAQAAYDSETLAQPGFTITPEMRETIMAGLPLFQGQGMDDKRGFIQFGRDRKFNITLLEKSDLSTFLHESGHFYLEVMGDFAEAPGAPQKVRDDFAKVLKFLGATSRADITLDGKAPGSAEHKRAVEMHEKFARANEAYLMEGKAPSLDLRETFQKFKEWLKLIYKELVNLDVELTDEVRGVFDRLYATDAEIEAAKNEVSVDALFLDAAAAGMTEAEFAAYKASVAQATESGKEALSAKLMREMLREKKAWWRQELERVRAEVAAEIDEQPVYKAFKALIDGEVKLDKQDLIDRYGQDYIKRLPRGFQRVYSRENGLDVNGAARLLGFETGDKLVEALVSMRPRNELIAAEAEVRMKQRHGDMLLDGSIADEAKAALHNSQREKVLAAELRALRRKQREVAPFLAVERQRQAGERQAARAATEMPPMESFRNAARGLIGQTAVRDLEPQRYLMAQRKHAKAAFEAMAKGDYQVAADAKQKEILNHYMYLEARKAREQADKIAEYMRKFDKKETRERLGKAGKTYLDQIDAILEGYEFRRVTNRQIDRRGSLQAFVEAQEAAGNPVNLQASLLEDSRQINYRQLNIDELTAIHEGVRNIESLARLKNKLLRESEKRTLDEIAEDAIEQIESNAKGGKAKKLESALPNEQMGRWLKGFMLMHTKFATLFRRMDGWQDGGVMWELFVRPLNERADFEAVKRADVTKKLREIFKAYRDTDMFKKRYLPGLGQGMTHQGRLMVALNWGRAENRQRIVDGNGLTQAQVNEILDSLDERDWKFVQDTWALIDSMWPEIEAQYTRLYGTAPTKSEGLTIQTKFGEIKGGYFPIKYDSTKSERAAAYDADEIAKQMRNGAYMRSQTKNGFTKEVMENVDRAVRLDFSSIYEHLDEVVHDLALREYLLDTNKLLNHKVNGRSVKEVIFDAYGDQVANEIRDTLKDIAVGDIGARNSFERAMAHLRSGVTIVGMGWNLMTGLMQPLGLTQSMVRVGPKWIAKGLMKWGSDAVQLENSAKVIYEKSDFMRTRNLTQNREINEIRNQIKRSGRFPIAKEAYGVVEDSYFQLIILGQKLVDIPTWLGAYEKALDGGADEAKAVALADQAVIDSQGGGAVKDLAAIQRGGALLKLWTTFYSYFNTTFQLTAESFGKTKFKDPVSVGRLAVDLVMLWTVPAILGTALKDAVNMFLGGEPDDEDEMLQKYIAAQANYIMGMVVGLREIATVFDPRYDYTGPAGSRFFAETIKLAKQIDQGELDAALARAANNVLGILFHYPAGQVQRTVQGVYALEEGETENPAAVVLGAPK